MKFRILIAAICICCFQSLALSQTMRFFEFTTNCGHGKWQDTSFIAATSNQVLIDTVLANIARPIQSRKFINGRIDVGHGGHNHNATHWFLWHFIPNEWSLVELAIEVCDGCPYSDVDADTAYWVRNIKYYCPWSGVPVREVADPLGVDMPNGDQILHVYPNPAHNELYILGQAADVYTVSIYNPMGQLVSEHKNVSDYKPINITHLQNGIYIILAANRYATRTQKLVVKR